MKSNSNARGKSRETTEFGDFQTPIELAQTVCEVLSRSGLRPATVLEPTCGRGTFLVAAAERFPAANLVGVERNPEYVRAAREALAVTGDRAKVREGDFFTYDWASELNGLPDPLLVLGNPPWVTNTELSALGSSNLPEKRNFSRHKGLDALTGKSNFDISEWMLLRVLEWMQGRRATMAMLCKTTVARKLLASAWSDHLSLKRADMYRLDASAHFGATVDACLLLCEFSDSGQSTECSVRMLGDDVERPVTTFGYRDGRLIANLANYERWKHLGGVSPLRWRSGIKHDCGAVMELREELGHLRNGLGEIVDIEDTYLYPMLKTSEVTAIPAHEPRRCMLVTQSAVGEDTSRIRARAPKTWAYLESHGEQLDRRKSSIYRDRCRFSIFGVGSYSFAPWKVVISGFYKNLDFKVLAPFREKPVVLDDLTYFLPCQDEGEAHQLVELLNSTPAREFYQAFIFWDSKRPVTIDVLARLDINALSRETGALGFWSVAPLLDLLDRPVPDLG